MAEPKVPLPGDWRPDTKQPTEQARPRTAGVRRRPEITISGAIKWTYDRAAREPDGHYVIRHRPEFAWALPTEHLEPNDLRVMADHLERTRAKAA